MVVRRHLLQRPHRKALCRLARVHAPAADQIPRLIDVVRVPPGTGRCTCGLAHRAPRLPPDCATHTQVGERGQRVVPQVPVAVRSRESRRAALSDVEAIQDVDTCLLAQRDDFPRRQQVDRRWYAARHWRRVSSSRQAASARAWRCAPSPAGRPPAGAGAAEQSSNGLGVWAGGAGVSVGTNRGELVGRGVLVGEGVDRGECGLCGGSVATVLGLCLARGPGRRLPGVRIFRGKGEGGPRAPMWSPSVVRGSR